MSEFASPAVRLTRAVRLAAPFLALSGAPVPAVAQESCAALPNPVYAQVGDTQEPLMKELGRRLRDEDPPITLVYLTSGSCTNIEAIYTDVPITKNMLYAPSSAEQPDWKPSDPAIECKIAAGGQQLELANSALFVSSCNPDGPPAGIKLFSGPVQPYGFVVPEGSSQRAITAEEAYFAFGFGDQSGAAPWNDERFMFIRTVTKSTLLTLAATISVPGSKWRGRRFDKSSEVMNALVASAMPEKAIGILGVELYDRNRDKLKLLAFRAFDQRYAYFPDSTSTAFDKRNVRDGHYVPWSPTVWLARVDAQGEPLDQDVGYVIDLILGDHTQPIPRFEPLDVVIDVGLVPDCAMSVTRSYEAGELAKYEPPEPCGCYYEAKTSGKTPDGCRTCEENIPCTRGSCRHGFCESR
jgi:hypothetical protein